MPFAGQPHLCQCNRQSNGPELHSHVYHLYHQRQRRGTGVTLMYTNVIPPIRLDGWQRELLDHGTPRSERHRHTSQDRLPVFARQLTLQQCAGQQRFTRLHRHPTLHDLRECGRRGRNVELHRWYTQDGHLPARWKLLVSLPAHWSGTVRVRIPVSRSVPPVKGITILRGIRPTQNYTPTLKNSAGCTDIDVSIGGAGQGSLGFRPMPLPAQTSAG